MKEIDELMHAITGLAQLNAALAVALIRQKKINRESLLETIDLMTAHAAVTISNDAAMPFIIARQFLAALTSSGADTHDALRYEIGMYAQAHPEMRSRLTSWLSRASESDISEALRRMIDNLPAAPETDPERED